LDNLLPKTVSIRKEGGKPERNQVIYDGDNLSPPQNGYEKAGGQKNIQVLPEARKERERPLERAPPK
jgi:hypothetical protein